MRITITIFLMTILVASGARAQPRSAPATPVTKISASQCKQAEKLRIQADELLAAGAIDKAIETYENAYALCAAKKLRAALTFNFGLAFKRRAERPIDTSVPEQALAQRRRAIEDRKSALARFRAFLELVPGGKLTLEAQANMAHLDAEIEEQETIATAEERRILDLREQAREAAELDRRRREQYRAEARRGRRLRVGAYTAAGLAGASFGIGTYYGLRARTLAQDLSRVTDWTPTNDAQVSEGERSEMRMILFTSIGGVALGVAGALYWMSRTRTDSMSMTLTMSVAPDAQLLGVSGRF